LPAMNLSDGPNLDDTAHTNTANKTQSGSRDIASQVSPCQVTFGDERTREEFGFVVS